MKIVPMPVKINKKLSCFMLSDKICLMSFYGLV